MASSSGGDSVEALDKALATLVDKDRAQVANAKSATHAAVTAGHAEHAAVRIGVCASRRLVPTLCLIDALTLDVKGGAEPERSTALSALRHLFADKYIHDLLSAAAAQSDDSLKKEVKSYLSKWSARGVLSRDAVASILAGRRTDEVVSENTGSDTSHPLASSFSAADVEAVIAASERIQTKINSLPATQAQKFVAQVPMWKLQKMLDRGADLVASLQLLLGVEAAVDQAVDAHQQRERLKAEVTDAAAKLVRGDAGNAFVEQLREVSDAEDLVVQVAPRELVEYKLTLLTDVHGGNALLTSASELERVLLPLLQQHRGERRSWLRSDGRFSDPPMRHEQRKPYWDETLAATGRHVYRNWGMQEEEWLFVKDFTRVPVCSAREAQSSGPEELHAERSKRPRV